MGRLNPLRHKGYRYFVPLVYIIFKSKIEIVKILYIIWYKKVLEAKVGQWDKSIKSGFGASKRKNRWKPQRAAAGRPPLLSTAAATGPKFLLPLFFHVHPLRAGEAREGITSSCSYLPYLPMLAFRRAWTQHVQKRWF